MVSITATGDGKVEFIAFEEHTLAHVRSAMGYPTYYPVYPVGLRRPAQAVLMDLDGTSVDSEHFWIWIIVVEKSVYYLQGALLIDKLFTFFFLKFLNDIWS